MNVLFVHQNFPGQFLHLSRALAQAGHQVVALCGRRHDSPEILGGVRVLDYRGYLPPQAGGQATSSWGDASDLHVKLIRAQACAKAALGLKSQGFEADVIVCHPGWGEPLLLGDIWPQARLGGYCEFYYRQEGADVGFDPEFQAEQAGPAVAMRLRLKNAAQDLFLTQMDKGISPTGWQQSLYPEPSRVNITVVHDGIDSRRARPNPDVSMTLNQLRLSRADEVVTFVNRNLEPYRGYHQFMRALPILLQRRPKARVVIVGGDGVSYGSAPPASVGKTWKEVFLNEVRGGLDLERVHFVGKLAYPTYLELLQLSSLHVYLTYPFVLSWSLLEAMSCACPIVASNTAPVREVIEDGENGLLCDFFSPTQLQDRVVALLEDRSLATSLGQRARETIIENYDLEKICLPRHLQWFEGLADCPKSR